MFKVSKFSTGFLVGFGAGFISRDLLANGSSLVRPAIKGVLKAGILLVEKGRESVAGFAEALEDLFAEVRSEPITKAAKEAAPITVPVTEATKPTMPSATQKS